MEKIKVLRIITRMNIGGPAIQTALLSRGLDKNRFSSTLITGEVGDNEGDMNYLAKEYGVEPLVISELHRELNIKRDIVSFFKLYRYLKKEKPDVVHTHTAKAGAIGRLAARLAGAPLLIHTFHGHIFQGYFGSFKTNVFLRIERMLTGITDKIVAISEGQKNDIRKFLKLNSGGKLVLIPLGFDLGKFLKDDGEDNRKKAREALNIPENAIVIGTVGRLTAIKNQKMFLKAAGEIALNNNDRKIKFLIAGDGELRDELKGMADELGLGKDVIFTGWRKDIELIYKAIDIAALTSLNEGTPVSLIEALASAKPIVATDVGGVRDVVEDGKSGLIVPSNDVNAFSKSLLILINDSEKRKKFGSCGRDLIKERYSSHRLIKAVEDLYSTELRKKGRRFQ